jgi:hypothetical protein
MSHLEARASALAQVEAGPSGLAEVYPPAELKPALQGPLSRCRAWIRPTRRRRVVARLVPAAEARPVPPWPDLEARARSIFGDRIMKPAGSTLLLRARGRW